MKKVFCIFCLAFTLHINAEVIKVAVITSEFNKNVTDYYVETDEAGNIDSMRYVTVMPNGAILNDFSVTAEKVINEGVVIEEKDERDVVILEVENFNVKDGGIVKLNYLYNGITKERKAKYLTLKLENSEFKLYDSKDEVNRLFLKAKKSIIGVIGIKEILSSFEK